MAGGVCGGRERLRELVERPGWGGRAAVCRIFGRTRPGAERGERVPPSPRPAGRSMLRRHLTTSGGVVEKATPGPMTGPPPASNIKGVYQSEGVTMTRSKPIMFLAGALALPLAALAVAGCGGGSSGGSASAAATTSTPSGGSATVDSASVGGLGTVLVDSQGRTLYLFQKDSGGKSACSGACATAWPPLRASGKPTVGSGAKASLVRAAAHSQVTYNNHPLYTFIK